jgi:hypothetical protein
MSLGQATNRSVMAVRMGREEMFIVQGKPRSPEGILKVIKQTRHEAMQAAYDLLEGGWPL